MAPVTNGRHLFNEIPTGYPEPGKTTVNDTSQTIDPDTVHLKPGSFLLKTLVLSIDPYMRSKMRDPSIESYSPEYVIGEPLQNFGVSVVLRSKNPAFKAGDHLYGYHRFEEYSIRDDVASFIVLKNEARLPWTVYVGAAGMSGQTAYFAWKEYSKAKAGEIAFVTTGAGPVGLMVIQLAKSQGLTVIASAGSDEKVKIMREAGADVPFNYKTTSMRYVLKKEAEFLGHCCSNSRTWRYFGYRYWDNVGGESLEAALDAAASGARFIECGMVSEYNTEPYPIKNISKVFTKSIKMSGFLVLEFMDKYLSEFYEVIPPKLASGELKYTEDITRGLENVGEAILAVQTGKNKGKSVIVVAEA
ncbi:hypothetical protein JAAARDRAFT_75057 [Jaapia argillacea MUCL 33604]|uniref:Enoyl reductase (ER) domain-containing protein n=1 Tax=Jaapia argillacea MUCL 33604 TaxID=933084 RepID=A0A067QE12_9AGAM|nr:hypothetical protein JAAARDRAFT_75057 [Jaapia argillacea MUCL 33604]